jgi:calcineurin-like phosphoesterase family protein
MSKTINYWFTSDTHYGHKNIIKYAERPFQSVEEMDQTMIANWNALVQPDDVVYHLGDFAFTNITRTLRVLEQLKGYKILTFGNHDRELRKHADFLKKWGRTGDLLDLKINDQPITLCHYAMRVWNKSHFGAWHLYGHSHGTLYDDPNALSTDVGVDPNSFTPVSFAQIAERMKKKTFVPIDKHGREE